MRRTLNWVMRTVSVVLSCVLVACLGLAGCTTEAEHPLEGQPSPLSETAKSPSGSNNAAVLWYDNTMSMAGFVKAQNRGTFVNSINAIVSTMLVWTDGRTYKVLDGPNEDGWLDWVDYSEGRFKAAAINQPVNETFYTFGGRKKFQENTGPLRLLFPTDGSRHKSPVDFGNLNIFITDLKEQNMNLADLARILHDACEGYDNHGVVLYALRSGFTGECYMSNNGSVIDGEAITNMVSFEMNNDPLQYYILASGATPDVLMFARSFEQNLRLSNVSDYESFTLLSNGGLRAAESKMFSPAMQTGTNGEARKTLKGTTSKDLPLDEIHGSLQLRPEKKIEALYQNYKVDRTVFGYRYDGTNNKNCNTALAKIYIPLPGLLKKGGEEDVGASKEVAVQWVFLEDANGKPPAGTLGVFLGDMMTLRYGSRGGWISAEEADYDLLKVYASVVANGTEQKLWDNNKDNRTAYICSNPSGALELTIEITATGNAGDNLQTRAKSGYLSIHIPLYARMPKSNQIPAWVNEWDFDYNRDTGKKDKFLRTDGLDAFFAALLGTTRNPFWEIPLAILDVDIDMCNGALDA